MIVPRVITKGATETAWVRERMEAADSELVGLHVGATEAARNAVAACAVTLWAWETGYGDGAPGHTGEGESNYNVGNVHCTEATPASVPCARVGDETVRAFSSLREGVAFWFAFVRDTYPHAWTLLVVGDLTYWSVLMSEGYGGHASADDALSVHSRVCRLAGVADMDDAERAEVRSRWDSPGMGAGDDGAGDGSSRTSSLVSHALIAGGVWGLGRAFRVW